MGWLILCIVTFGAALVYRHYSRAVRRRNEQEDVRPPRLVGGEMAGDRRSDEIDLTDVFVELERDLQGYTSRTEPIFELRPEVVPSPSQLTKETAPERLSASRSAKGQPLRLWREHRGSTLRELADGSGIDHSIVQQIENGTRTPSALQAQALANHLRVNLDDIQFPVRSAFGSHGRTLADIGPSAKLVSPPKPIPAFGSRTDPVTRPTMEGRSADLSVPHAPGILRAAPEVDPARTYSVVDARRRLDLTIPKLAAATGLPAWRLEQIENGTRTPSTDDVRHLSRALEIQPEKLAFRAPPAAKVASLGERMGKFSQILRPSEEPFRWVGSPEIVQIAGHTIPGGMFFLGKGMRSPQGPRPARSLIDPGLKVASSNADVSGLGAPYWPSYSDIGPASRLAFLKWMAGGRKDPDYAICYVFIFLYGLERRLVLDRVHREAPEIATELRRLLAIYGTDYSFRSYATKLLGAATALSDDVDLPEPSLKAGYEEELPVAVRLRVGRLIASGRNLQADDALTWLLAHPETFARTPVERCFDEARLLWTSKFVEKYPQGLKVGVPKRTIRFRYAAASGEFEADVLPTLAGAPIPDVVALTAPLAWMRDTLAASSDELQSYSRLLGRKPEARGTLEAALLLPRALEHTDHGSAASAARLALKIEVAGSASMTLRDVLPLVSMKEPEGGKVSASLIGQLGSLLDRLDFGFEPDRRYGPGMPELDTAIVLFETAGGCRVDGSRDTYKAMRTMIEVAALAAAADERKDSSELAAIEADIEAELELEANERLRLRAFARFAMMTNARKNGVLSRLSKMTISERRQMARGAMAVVLADGHASPSEIRFLEKLYKTMKLQVDELYSAVHRGVVEVDEPVSIIPEETVDGVAIPRPPLPKPSRPSSSAIVVDQARLDRIRSETSAVSQLLAEIFEEEEASASTMQTRGEASEGLDGLDAAHSGLLRRVHERRVMDQTEFETLAREFGVLPGGALETINEWAFDRFDEPILEETDEGIEFSSNLAHALQRETETA